MNEPRYEREQATAIRAVRQAARLVPGGAGGDQPGGAGQEGQEPGHGGRLRQPGGDLPGVEEAFPDDPIIAEEDSAELRQPENAANLDQVVEHLRALVPGMAIPQPTTSAAGSTGGRPGEYRGRFWTVDPIDGTKGFLRSRAVRRRAGARRRGPGRCCGPGMSEPAPHDERWRGARAMGAIFTAVRGQGAFAVPLDRERDDEPDSLIPSGSANTDDPAASGSASRSNPATVPTAMRLRSRRGSGSSRRRSGWTARRSMGSSRGARLRSTSACPPRADYREKIWDHAAGCADRRGGRRHRDRYRGPAPRVPPRPRAERQPRRDCHQRQAARAGYRVLRALGLT